MPFDPVTTIILFTVLPFIVGYCVGKILGYWFFK